MAKRLMGKPVVEALAREIGAHGQVLAERGIAPGLALVRVGERPDDLSYERTAEKRACALGVQVKKTVLPEDAAQDAIEAAIRSVNEDAAVHGCLMFRPLPSGIDEQAVCDALATEKDIDGVSSAALASVFMDRDLGFAPCTAAACMKLLDFYDVALEGAHVVVVGRSLVIGKPIAMMLLRRNATVTLCHSRTADLPAVMRGADIVVCATGRPRMFKAECFSAGQTVLDVGINFDDEGNLCGDVDFDEVEPIVAAITPVPGGIGSVTTSVLMAHTVEAAVRKLDA
ncbi:bifunctional 5,10-methylenetetrahydrofolate dehydrogenase/5,10-methenyltetrahydrofolate cyclohydrolase [Raoultibacter phocaeensis]|uniref:bifunctional 5,10-methylenetetrahydrofolate dehydrogenase/5,10-methenyltetrahydrofolate cyclohydrolase n=1 Tax=Raoultibacter phocaeensis TaxID=2479841 RepID=UPI00111AA812|nr:bifunctional 5,10-methylenetetrahydrofolate dehydrogenase/5,10-methenyltetrahydrofolate cyclohydrolase [Raoultibacter phocaeensis]